MLFSSQKKLLKDINLKLGDDSVHKVSTYKYLGVTLDPLLNFELFVRNKLKAVSYRAYQLSKLSCYLSKEALIRLYKSYVLPIVDFGDVLYMLIRIMYLVTQQIAKGSKSLFDNMSES